LRTRDSAFAFPSICIFFFLFQLSQVDPRVWKRSGFSDTRPLSFPPPPHPLSQRPIDFGIFFNATPWQFPSRVRSGWLSAIPFLLSSSLYPGSPLDRRPHSSEGTPSRYVFPCPSLFLFLGLSRPFFFFSASFRTPPCSASSPLGQPQSVNVLRALISPDLMFPFSFFLLFLKRVFFPPIPPLVCFLWSGFSESRLTSECSCFPPLAFPPGLAERFSLTATPVGTLLPFFSFFARLGAVAWVGRFFSVRKAWLWRVTSTSRTLFFLFPLSLAHRFTACP